MKKYLKLLIIIVTLLTLGACHNANSNNEKSSVEENKNIIQDTIVQKRDIEKVVFSETYTMKIENVYNGEIVNDLIVANYKYDTVANNDAKFSFMLKGEFISDGEIMIDKMSDKLVVQFDKNSNPHKNIIIKIDKHQKQLIDLCHFRNQEVLLVDLTEEEVKKLEIDKPVKITIRVNDVRVSGKIDGLDDISVGFVEIIR